METTFYRDDGAVVTNARFMANGETHALSGITSISRYIHEPSRGVPAILALVGFGMFFTQSLQGIVVALIFIAVAVMVWVRQKPIHTVAIRTAAGELRVLEDQNGERVGKIIDALNAAIVHRA